MIQLYNIGNEDFSRNGDVILAPALCDVSAVLNNSWFMTLEHPIDKEGRFDHLKNGVTIKAPTFMPEAQLFRVYNTVKNDDSVTVYARPIFLDAAGEVFLMDCRPTQKTGQGAMNELFAGQSKYSGKSDIQAISTAYYIRKNVIDAIQGGDENSFLNRWGGEILYDNYQIIANFRVGADNGQRVEMGYNCDGLESDIDDREVVTRIVPVAYNGYTLPGDTPWVDSPLINRYPVIKQKEIVFEYIKLAADANEGEEAYETLEELYAALRTACEEQFELGIDKPKAAYKCEMIDIAKTDAYKDLKYLESISLGDTVYCKNKIVGIETTARAVKIVYDCIRKCNKSVELGDFRYNYFDELASTAKRLNSAIDKYGYVHGNKIFGTIDGMLAQLRVQSTAAQKVSRPAYLMEDLDPDSPTYGAMCLGTQGFQISREKDAEGNWIWTTFGTANGFVADCIFAGILSDKGGNNYWNLDTGEFRLAAASKIGDKTIQEMQNTTITKVDVEYAQGDSSTIAPTGGWATDAPVWQSGKYIWQRTATTNGSGKIIYSEATCIQGATGKDGVDGRNGKDGDNGADGIGITGLVEQYYLSTSSTTQSGSSWSTAQPEWAKGKYIWTRSAVTWSDGTTTYTAPVLAKAINGANESVQKLDNKLDQEEVFKRLTDNGRLQGIYMENGLLYINGQYMKIGKIVSRNYNEEAGTGFMFDLNTGELRAGSAEFEGIFKSVNADGIGARLKDAILSFLYENRELAAVTAAPSISPDGSVLGGALDLWAQGEGEIRFRIGEKTLWSIDRDSIPSIPFTGAYTGTVTVDSRTLKFTNGILYGVT